MMRPQHSSVGTADQRENLQEFELDLTHIADESPTVGHLAALRVGLPKSRTTDQQPPSIWIRAILGRAHRSRRCSRHALPGLSHRARLRSRG